MYRGILIATAAVVAVVVRCANADGNTFHQQKPLSDVEQNQQQSNVRSRGRNLIIASPVFPPVGATPSAPLNGQPTGINALFVSAETSVTVPVEINNLRPVGVPSGIALQSPPTTVPRIAPTPVTATVPKRTNKILGFKIINAITDQSVDILTNGAQIPLTRLGLVTPDQLNFEVMEPIGSTIKSLQLLVTGNSTFTITERGRPFTLCGDKTLQVSGKKVLEYNLCAKLRLGITTITAIPDGKKVDSYSVTFTIVNATVVAPPTTLVTPVASPVVSSKPIAKPMAKVTGSPIPVPVMKITATPNAPTRPERCFIPKVSLS
jgi:hypothetical protein